MRTAHQTAVRYAGTFHGEPGQVGRVRDGLRAYLAGCPRSDDAILIASELAANAVPHSRSAGQSFTVRAEVSRDCIRVEVEDLGGPWLCRQQQDGRHGLDIVTALASGWGVETSGGCRVTWARVAVHDCRRAADRHRRDFHPASHPAPVAPQGPRAEAQPEEGHQVADLRRRMCPETPSQKGAPDRDGEPFTGLLLLLLPYPENMHDAAVRAEK
jgi:serine/threonine-protein kinase RsbW